MEPERRIEKWLRAFAKKRREQAGDPVELRPAARQRLHAEISRRAEGKSAGGFFDNFLAAFRPRLALALMAVAIVAVGAFLLVPGRHEESGMKLASINSPKRQMSAPLAPPETPAPAAPALAPPAMTPPAPVIAARDYDTNNPSVAMEKNALKPAGTTAISGTFLAANEKAEERAAMDKKVPALAGSAGGANVALTPATKEELAYKDQLNAGGSTANTGAIAKSTFDRLVQPPVPASTTSAAQNTSVTVVAAAPVPAREGSRKWFKSGEPAARSIDAASFANLAVNVNSASAPVASQAFNRITVRRTQPAGASGLSTPVLSTFRLEQQGDELRVVDADGSIYTGAVQWARQEAAQNANAAKVNLPPKNTPFANQVARNVQQIQNYYFRVAGTNRNLKQAVVFSGNLIPLTNAPISQFKTFGGGGGGQNMPEQAPTQALLSNSRITGTAVIGGEREIEVNATPAR